MKGGKWRSDAWKVLQDDCLSKIVVQKWRVGNDESWCSFVLVCRRTHSVSTFTIVSSELSLRIAFFQVRDPTAFLELNSLIIHNHKIFNLISY